MARKKTHREAQLSNLENITILNRTWTVKSSLVFNVNKLSASMSCGIPTRSTRWPWKSEKIELYLWFKTLYRFIRAPLILGLIYKTKCRISVAFLSHLHRKGEIVKSYCSVRMASLTITPPGSPRPVTVQPSPCSIWYILTLFMFKNLSQGPRQRRVGNPESLGRVRFAWKVFNSPTSIGKRLLIFQNFTSCQLSSLKESLRYYPQVHLFPSPKSMPLSQEWTKTVLRKTRERDSQEATLWEVSWTVSAYLELHPRGLSPVL